MEPVGITVCVRWFLGRGCGRSGVEKGLAEKTCARFGRDVGH
jgi:hypothetical protein